MIRRMKLMIWSLVLILALTVMVAVGAKLVADNTADVQQHRTNQINQLIDKVN
jgi:hypothetical protein